MQDLRDIDMVAVASLVEHPENEKTYGPTPIDEGLVESLKERGVLQPLVITPDEPVEDLDAFDASTYDGHYTIVAGHRRAAAAKAAGMEFVPATIRVYEDDADCIIDLIHSNKHREKTSAQINTEIQTLRAALSEQAKARQKAGLKQGEEEGASPSASIEANGRTNHQIADKTGLSRSEVERRSLVTDPEFRTEFYEKMRTLGATDEQVQSAKKQWAHIHRSLDIGQISVSAAAKKVKEMKQEMIELCPDYKPPKKARKKKTTGTAKSKVEFPILSAEEIVEDTYREHGEHDGRSYGLLDGTPAVRSNGHVLVLEWSTLATMVGPKLDKASAN